LNTGFVSFMNVLNQLPGGTPDLHIGVVSSSMGAGDNFDLQINGCKRGGDGGALQALPRGACAGPGPSDAYLALSQDSVTGQVRTNYGAQSLPDAFSCIAMLGDTGCGFEQPLSAVRHALDPTLMPSGNQGFLRADAFLAVILVTNEDDCSAPDGTDLFDTASSRLSDPLGPLSSFRCNEFGHVCRVGGTLQHPSRTTAGTYDGCESDEHGKLEKVSNFVTFLRGLKADPAKVFFASIAGPPTPYTVKLEPSASRDDPGSWPLIDHSCTAPGDPQSYADPAVRLDQAVTAFGRHGVFGSICGDDMGPLLQSISSRLSRPLAPACVTVASVANPVCTVVDRWVYGDGTKHVASVPACADAPDVLPCWRLLVDGGACGDTDRRLEVKRDRGAAVTTAHLFTAVDCSGVPLRP
jgi:hypothetical protein